MARYIGVDIGGTNIVFGVVDEASNCLLFKKVATEADKGSTHVIQTIAAHILDLAEQTDEPILAVGVGVPGFVDHANGIAVSAVNLGWENYPVVAELEKLITIPIYINNDVRLYVYGEALAGAGRNYKHVLGVTLGTGIASAMVNEGQLYYGSGNRAGELGHITMPGNTYACKCGLVGCLETIASANGIVRQAKDAIIQGGNSLLKLWYPGDQIDKVTALDVSNAYDQGDILAIKVMEDTGVYLAKGLAYAINFYSPDLIVIGGGAAMAGERLLGPMKRQLQASILPLYWEGLSITIAQRVEDAGIIGGALYAKNQLS
ncbi:ROK family protein [Paenibacillus psychroresistens]|uniref:ROK family protein n=1 Tax=Paenibacillus psychroresistens TaxID=1778678 RepID=A0A6B8RP36_9BACL|nr:ROK family protein [Paenibacillus psychroresistens]QGQ97136.1 ROK family protein [Paenibacillus psychroresistens]